MTPSPTPKTPNYFNSWKHLCNCIIIVIKHLELSVCHAAVTGVTDYNAEKADGVISRDYHLSSSLFSENRLRKGGRPSLTHHIKIPLGGHGSVRRKAVEVEQRGQDWCASAAGDGARALTQTTQTL